MTRATPQIYEVSEREYNNLRRFWKGLFSVSLVTGLTGLAGVVTEAVLNSSGNHEISGTAREILDYSLPALGVGGYLALWSGINYLANPPLNRTDNTSQ